MSLEAFNTTTKSGDNRGTSGFANGQSRRLVQPVNDLVSFITFLSYHDIQKRADGIKQWRLSKSRGIP